MLKSSASLSSILITALSETIARAPSDVGPARAFRRTYNPLFQERPLLQLCSMPYSSRSKAYKAREVLMEMLNPNSNRADRFMSFVDTPFVAEPVVHAEADGFVIAVVLDKDKTLKEVSGLSSVYSNNAFHEHMQNVAKLLENFLSEESFETFQSKVKAKAKQAKLDRAARERRQSEGVSRMVRYLANAM